MSPFLLAGACAVVGGGFIAAVSRPTGWEHGPWVAAFLVLVAGVGQVGLGAGQSVTAANAALPRRTVVTESILWNVGSSTVLLGTLTAAPSAVSAGGILLVAALVLFALAPRGADAPASWPQRAYYALVITLLVSTPVGLALSWLRS